MPDVKLDGDFKKVLKWAESISPQAAKPALNYTLNRIGVRIKNQSASEVARVQKLKTGLVKKRLREVRSTFKKLQYKASADVRGITWASLDPVVRKSRTKARRSNGIKAGKHAHKHAFVGTGKHGKRLVFVRAKKDTKRLPVRVLRVRLNTPFARAFANNLIKSRSHLAPTFAREFIRRLDRLNNRTNK